MPESNDRHGQTSTEAEGSIAGARTPGETLRGHPFALGFLAVFAAAAIFLLGVRVGEAAYLAFDGEGMMAAVFGATFVTVLVVIIGSSGSGCCSIGASAPAIRPPDPSPTSNETDSGPTSSPLRR